MKKPPNKGAIVLATLQKCRNCWYCHVQKPTNECDNTCEIYSQKRKIHNWISFSNFARHITKQLIRKKNRNCKFESHSLWNRKHGREKKCFFYKPSPEKKEHNTFDEGYKQPSQKPKNKVHVTSM